MLVAEIDVLKSNHTLGDHKLTSSRTVYDRRLQIDHLEHAAPRDRSPSGRIDDHSDLPDRLLENRHERQKFGELTERERALDDLESAGPEHKSHRSVIRKYHDAGVDVADL